MSNGILNQSGLKLRSAITRVDPKDEAEQKEYLILGCLGEETFFKFCTGRTETYQYIKDNIDCIDPYESYVLVEGKNVEDRITVYTFVEAVAKRFITDDFDINDYVIGDPIQEEKKYVETPSYMEGAKSIDNFLDSKIGGEEI